MIPEGRQEPEAQQSAQPQQTKSIRQRAVDWARSGEPSGIKVTRSERAILLELAMWCGSRIGFEPSPPLHKTATTNGLLANLGMSYHAYLQHVRRLQKKGLITKVSHGGGQRDRRGTRYTKWRLNVTAELRTEYQETLFGTKEDFRTDREVEDVSDMTPRHERNDVSDMTPRHARKVSDMTPRHARKVSDMTPRHARNTRPLYRNTSIRDDTPKVPSPTSTESGSSSRDRNTKNPSADFCSKILAALERHHVGGLTYKALAYVNQWVGEFVEIHDREPDTAEADYIAEQTTNFIEREPTAHAGRIMSFIETITEGVLTSGVSRITVTQPRDTMPDDAARPYEPEPLSSDEAWRLTHDAWHVRDPSLPRGKLPSQAWGVAMEQLREQISRPAYETWFKDTLGLAHEGGEFVVGVRDAFVGEMLEHRMYPLIERALEAVLGELAQVRFVVVPLSEMNAADCPLCAEPELIVDEAHEITEQRADGSGGVVELRQGPYRTGREPPDPLYGRM